MLEDDFDAFVRRHSPALLRAGWLLTGDWPGAEDLVQVALERTWPRWGRLAEDGQRLAYVRRVMLTAFLRNRSRRWSGEVPTEQLPEATPPDPYDLVSVRADLLGAVHRLPPRQRAVITLRYFADLTETQTAAALHCRRGTVKRYAHTALTTLRADNELTGLLDREDRP